MVCSLLLWHYWSLCLWDWGGLYSKCECRAVQIHVGNISAHWFTSSSARFAVVPTEWSNCSQSRNFHASPQNYDSGQTLCSVGDITWPARSPDSAVQDYFLWGYVKNKVYDTRPASIADLKQRILECIQGIPKEILQRVMAGFCDCSSVLNDKVVTYKVSYSKNDWDEFSWTWNILDSVNKILSTLP